MRNKSIICLLLLEQSTAIKQVSTSEHQDILNPDVLDEIANEKNEFTHMALKEHKKEEPIENIGVSEEMNILGSDHINDELDDGASSYQSLMEKKNELTSEIRSAGITG